MTDEEIRKMNKVTSRYTRGHMFKMMNEREPVIKENLAEIEARELENDEYMKMEIEELYPSEEIGIFSSSSDVVKQEVKKDDLIYDDPNSTINQISPEQENLPIVFNQFMNGNFLASSSAVLNEDTAMNQDLCSHTKLITYYIDEDDIKRCEETNKKELMILFNLETILKKYTDDSDFNILLLSDEALETLIKEAKDNGEQIKELDESTINVKRKLYRSKKSKSKDYYDCV